MLKSSLPFAWLQALLTDLCFVERIIEGKYIGFFHADSDILFAFRKYGPQDKVSLADIVSVRKQLAWCGLLNEEAFDASLSRAAV